MRGTERVAAFEGCVCAGLRNPAPLPEAPVSEIEFCLPQGQVGATVRTEVRMMCRSVGWVRHPHLPSIGGSAWGLIHADQTDRPGRYKPDTNRLICFGRCHPAAIIECLFSHLPGMTTAGKVNYKVIPRWGWGARLPERRHPVDGGMSPQAAMRLPL